MVIAGRRHEALRLLRPYFQYELLSAMHRGILESCVLLFMHNHHRGGKITQRKVERSPLRVPYLVISDKWMLIK
jgi:hypothetical protein